MARPERAPGRPSAVLIGCLLVVVGLLTAPTSLAAPLSSFAADDDGVLQAGVGLSARDKDGDGIDDALLEVERLGAAAGRFPDGFPRLMFRDSGDGLVYDVFVRFAGTVDASVAHRVADVTGSEARAFPLAEAVWVRDVPAALFDPLLALPGALAIEADRPVVPMVETASATHMVRGTPETGKGARERWKVTGHGINIAVLDTGIDDEHPTFGVDRRLGGYDATYWFLRDNDTNHEDPDSRDTYTHGTYVAGVALGVGKRTDDVVFGGPVPRNKTGIAPGANYLDVKVMTTDLEGNAFGLGSEELVAGTGSMVLEGLEFVHRYNANESHLGNVSRDEVDIVLMALGETSPDEDGNSTLSRAVDNLTATGVIVVASAGNCGAGARTSQSVWDLVYRRCERVGANTVSAPGAARSAITVSAFDDVGTVEWDDDTTALFSSAGPNGGEPKPNVAASGVHIEGPMGQAATREGLWQWQPAEDRYQNLSGTSPSAAVVAGVVALMKEADKGLSPERAKEILMVTARDIDDDDWDPRTGAGAVDAYDAVGVVLGYLNETLFNGTKEEGPREEPAEAPEPPSRPARVINRAPRVAFSISEPVAATGQPVLFSDASWDPEGDELVSWVWDFGDGKTGSGRNITHVYDRPGVFKVRLTVTDKNETGSVSNVGRQDIIVKGEPVERDVPAPGAGLILVALLVLVLSGTLRRLRPTGPPKVDRSP